MRVPQTLAAPTAAFFAEMGVSSDTVADLTKAMTEAEGEFGFKLIAIWRGECNGNQIGCEIRRIDGVRKDEWTTHLVVYRGTTDKVEDRYTAGKVMAAKAA